MITKPKEALRFITTDGQTEIRAKLKATGKYATLGYCHPATVALIKRDGIHKHMVLVTIHPPRAQPNKKNL